MIITQHQYNPVIDGLRTQLELQREFNQELILERNDLRSINRELTLQRDSARAGYKDVCEALNATKGKRKR